MGSAQLATGRKGIDWIAAKAFYLGLKASERSYGAVGREFGVSDTMVGRIAKRENWAEAAAKADSRRERILVAQSLRAADQRDAQHHRLLTGLLLAAEEDLERLAAELKPSDIPHIIRALRLVHGESTEHVEIRQVREYVVTVFRVAGRFVPAERREEFLAEADRALGELPAGPLDDGDGG